MQAPSASRSQGSVAARISNAASTLSSDNQSLIAEIRKALTMMRSVAVDLEKQERPDKVKDLEAAVLELLATYDDCTRFSEAIRTVGSNYQPSEEPTHFKKLLDKEVAKSKREYPFVPQNNQFYRQFKEAIWNVHHAGQPMPGEEQEDIIMTSTQTSLLNIICPLTGKPVTELQQPVRCMDCKHIYEMDPIIHYIRTKKPHPRCPVAGCPKILQVGRVVCDALLPIEIDEIRSAPPINSTTVEDVTEVGDE
ncbi:E3 SUMO-protein ligase [Canna indica]|uniref:E3 SUMO-protein ligase n=1 Tax=Canna indica TaxID=4628 RepID=A0AAQ3KVX5_9LILI|nr:E3 SUMO-protein ligase [Canna indica]